MARNMQLHSTSHMAIANQEKNSEATYVMINIHFE